MPHITFFFCLYIQNRQLWEMLGGYCAGEKMINQLNQQLQSRLLPRCGLRHGKDQASSTLVILPVTWDECSLVIPPLGIPVIRH